MQYFQDKKIQAQSRMAIFALFGFRDLGSIPTVAWVFVLSWPDHKSGLAYKDLGSG